MPLTETDRQLINRLLSGSSAGWVDFVDRYAPLVTQVVRHTAHAHSLKLNPDDLDDLTADVFAALLERDLGTIRGFRGRSSFATYLTVVIRRIALRKLTQRRYLQAFGHVKAHQSSLVSGEPDAVSRQVDAQDEVDSLMVRLPESMRSVLSMFFLKGESYQSISRKLGVPVNSIGPTIARAKALLRRSNRPTSS